MNEPVDVLVGRQFGNYRLVRALGHGGFASVYLGENIYINNLVAVKVLHATIEDSEMERFRLEARTIATLKHPHIVQLIDFGLEQMVPYLVMSYAPHGHLRQLQATFGAFPLPTVVSYIKQIASALQFAHDHKVIHRDIKPENILLDAHDTLLLSDFGIALVVQTTRQPGNRDITGTLAYMAPEQMQGNALPASDQYSLGVTTYELLTGQRLFQGSLSEIVAQHFSAPPPSLREKLPTLPISVEQVILRSLAKNPQERFPSVSAFAQALEEASQLQQTQSAYQDISILLSQVDTLTPSAQQSFEGKTSRRAFFPNTQEKADSIQPTSAASDIVLSSFGTTPIAPSVPASPMPLAPSFISPSLASQMYSKVASSSSLPTSPPSSLRAESLPIAQNFLSGKRSYKLLSIILICLVLIVISSAIFMVHYTNTHMPIQTVFISSTTNKHPTTVPTVSGPQTPAANAKSTPQPGKNATMIVSSAATSTPTGNPISTATAAAPTPLSTPTPIPTAVPTPPPTAVIPVTIPTATPMPQKGACSSFTGYYKIVNKNSGKYLDVFGAALIASTHIVQYTNNGKIDQQWSFVPTSAGYCKIINRNSHELLNIPGPTTTAATQLIQFPDDGNLNSQWELIPVGSGFYKIVSRYDSQCIDVSQAALSDNAAVIQFPDNGGANQQWQLILV